MFAIKDLVILIICMLFVVPGLGQDSARVLKEITVKARPSLISQEIDRISYDAQKDPDRKVESAIEMLSKVPLLAVDGDGNIQLNGSGRYRIFINGKPSSITTRHPKEALKAMPALVISRIEVITTPPARYDGEGLAGIINIVTIKQRQDGYNGSAGVSYKGYVGTGEHGSFTIRQGKLGVNFYGYLYQDQQVITSESVSGSVFRQEGQNTYHSRFGAGTTELSYEVDSLLLLTGSITWYDSHDYHSSNKVTVVNDVAAATGYNKYLHTGALDVNASLEKGFNGKKGRLLSVAYQYHHIPEALVTNVQYNNSLTEEYTIEAGYTHPVRKWMMESGVKLIDRAGRTWGKSIFRYDQQVWSVFNSWQYNSRLIDVKAGARLEYAVLQQGTYFTNLLPVISLMHKFPHAGAGLSYAQRIERPSLTQLNPFIDNSNPFVYLSGNPLLQPVKLHKADLSYTMKSGAGFHSMLTWQFSSNDIQQVVSVKDTLSVNSYQNIGRMGSVRLNAGVNCSLSDRIRLIANVDGGWLSFNTNSGWVATGFINIAYKISELWWLTSSVYATTPVVTWQGRNNGSVMHVTRISKTFLHNQLSVSAAISNPYSRYRYIVADVETAQFSLQQRIQRYYRTIGITAGWNFGKLTGNIKKAQRNIRNEDVELQQKKN